MIVAVDLDHTLRHSAWRDEHIAPAMEDGKLWDAYHVLSKEDKPALPIIELVIALHNAGHEIYIVTAVPRKWLRQNFAWLHKAGILVDQDHILMRPHDEFQPAVETKQGLIEGLNVDLFIDDRQDVCFGLANDGITTLQVRLVS